MLNQGGPAKGGFSDWFSAEVWLGEEFNESAATRVTADLGYRPNLAGVRHRYAAAVMSL